MADSNTVDYYGCITGSIIYTDSGTSGPIWASPALVTPPAPPERFTLGTGWKSVLGFEPEPGSGPKQDINRKEMNDMIQRQTFLDALADEGKSAGSEGREIVKEAKTDKWELLIARLLARAFVRSDLAMLKEKPKQVEVLAKEA